jgi:hypothetical protein
MLHPHPDAMRGVALLARSFTVTFQNRIDKLDCRLELPSRSLMLLSRLRQGASDRLAHHPSVHSYFLGHSGDRPDPKLKLPANLFE